MSKASRFTDDDFGLIESSLRRPARDVAKEFGWRVRDVYDMRYKLKNGWVRTDPGPWNDDELAIIASPFLTIEQMESRLPGRTASAIRTQRFRSGLGDKSKVGLAKTSPFMPGRRPLLAKTCTKCGTLYGAAMFGSAGRHSYCKLCASAGTQSRANRGKKDATRAYQKAAQALTERYAQKRGQEYTESDHVVLKDESKTVLEKALVLSRTYSGVGAAMQTHGYKARHITGDPKRDQWLIDNPNADRIEEITAMLAKTEPTTPTRPDFEWDD